MAELGVDVDSVVAVLKVVAEFVRVGGLVDAGREEARDHALDVALGRERHGDVHDGGLAAGVGDAVPDAGGLHVASHRDVRVVGADLAVLEAVDAGLAGVNTGRQRRPARARLGRGRCCLCWIPTVSARNSRIPHRNENGVFVDEKTIAVNRRRQTRCVVARQSFENRGGHVLRSEQETSFRRRVTESGKIIDTAQRSGRLVRVLRNHRQMCDSGCRPSLDSRTTVVWSSAASVSSVAIHVPIAVTRTKNYPCSYIIGGTCRYYFWKYTGVEKSARLKSLTRSSLRRESIACSMASLAACLSSQPSVSTSLPASRFL